MTVELECWSTDSPSVSKWTGEEEEGIEGENSFMCDEVRKQRECEDGVEECSICVHP